MCIWGGIIPTCDERIGTDAFRNYSHTHTRARDSIVALIVAIFVSRFFYSKKKETVVYANSQHMFWPLLLLSPPPPSDRGSTSLRTSFLSKRRTFFSLFIEFGLTSMQWVDGDSFAKWKGSPHLPSLYWGPHGTLLKRRTDERAKTPFNSRIVQTGKKRKKGTKREFFLVKDPLSFIESKGKYFFFCNTDKLTLPHFFFSRQFLLFLPKWASHESNELRHSSSLPSLIAIEIWRLMNVDLPNTRKKAL